MKKILLSFSIFICFISVFSVAYADDTNTDANATTTVADAPTLVENITIRDGSTIIFSGAVPLPTASTLNLNDNAGVSHSIDARSVLAILNNVDASSSDFSISNLEYNNSFSSFYLKCMTDSVGNQCDNWQYTINNSYPSVGMDKNILAGGENIYIYFGPQNKILLSSSDINTSDTLTVTAEEYDYQNNAWKPRTGVTVGLTQPNPSDPWSPLEVQTHMVDATSQAIFTGIPVGSYSVGIQQDFYFPTEALTVKNPIVITSGGGGGVSSVVVSSGGGYIAPIFSTPKALAYLEGVQGSDGSFGGNSLYTDWASIALVAGDSSDNIKKNIINYMSSHNTVSPIITENERHALALLSLGQNPYSFYGVDYITPIINFFDGTQFGDASLINDDIFALITLTNAGYTLSDNIIVKDIQYILQKQKINGSWEESVDITSAAIQSLKPFSSINGVPEALIKGSSYLANEQKSDGSWGNIYSTSWAMMAMNSLGVSWTKSGKSPLDYFVTQQSTDGAIMPLSETLQNRIWATSYAIPAALGKSWGTILHSVSKPTPTPTPKPAPTPLFVKPVENKPIVVEKVSSPASSTQATTSETLSASVDKSGTKIPTVVIIVAVVFLSGILLKTILF